MKNGPKKTGKDYINRRKWNSRWKKIVSSLAAITVFCTTYALILPAITVNSETYCGFEEHEHTDACYTVELTCEFANAANASNANATTGDESGTATTTQTITETIIETEIQEVLVDPGHTHQDSCYDEEENLICGEEEREAVYEQQEVEIEKTVEKEVEVPAEPAAPAQSAASASDHNNADGDASGHVHTEECYTKIVTCGKTEHKHSDECFSNPNLDLESAADWEATLPSDSELTGDWAEDTLTIARSQLGYQESSKNFRVIDNERKGYTRYGAWYGAPYSDWCAMFIQFSMHYAGVDTRLMPASAGVGSWIKNMTKMENYFDPADYTPQPGDIVFFDWDPIVEGGERDGDHVGLVAEVKTKEETTADGAKVVVPVSIIAIEGNSGDEVRYNTYKIDDETILGYAAMPVKPETEEELQERLAEIEEIESKHEEVIDITETVVNPDGTPVELPSIIALSSFTESGVQVNFSAPKSVFPEGVVDPALNVVEIEPGTPEYEACLMQAEIHVTDAATTITSARFFDISVVDIDGREIKLNDESKASVEIIFPEATVGTQGNVDVLHFAEEGIEVLGSEAQGDEVVETVSFETPGFSIFGVVEVQEITESFITADGESYTVTLTYAPEANIPKDAYLTAEEILEGTEEYDSYVEQTIEAMEGVTSLKFARFFDITIHDAEGNKIEPAAPVDVRIAYEGSVGIFAEQEVTAVHFTDSGEVEIIEAALDLESETETTDVVFTQDGFSVTGTVVAGSGGAAATDPSNQPQEQTRYEGYISISGDIPHYLKHTSGTYIWIVRHNESNETYALGIDASGNKILTPVTVYQGGKVVFEESVTDLTPYHFDIVPNVGEISGQTYSMMTITKGSWSHTMVDCGTSSRLGIKEGLIIRYDTGIYKWRTLTKSGTGWNFDTKVDDMSQSDTHMLLLNEGFIKASDTSYETGVSGGSDTQITENIFPTETGKYVIVVQKPGDSRYYALGVEGPENGKKRILTEVQVVGGKVTFPTIDKVEDLKKYEFYYSNYTKAQYGGTVFRNNYLIDNNGDPLAPYYEGAVVTPKYDNYGNLISAGIARYGRVLTPMYEDAAVPNSLNYYNYANKVLANNTWKRGGYVNYDGTSIYTGRVKWDNNTYYEPLTLDSNAPYYTLGFSATSSDTKDSNWKNGDEWGFAYYRNQNSNNRLSVKSFSTYYESGVNDHTGGNTGSGIINPFPSSDTDLGVPEHNKTITSNDNGTYILSLDVKGKTASESAAPMADVVIVLDKSNSMVDNNVGNETRLEVARRQAYNLIDTLIDGDLDVKIGLVTFGTHARKDVTLTKDKNALKAPIGTTPPGKIKYTDGTTNWDQALQYGNQVLYGQGSRADARKYVIFITDGDPVVYSTPIGHPDEIPMNTIWNDQPAGVYGAGTNDAQGIAFAYTAAKPRAKEIVQGGADLFSIGIFGDVHNLRDLTAYAYSGGSVGTHPDGRYAHASNGEALQNIINSISTAILANYSYEDVKISDTLTDLTASAISNAPTNITHYRYGGGYGDPWTEFGTYDRSIDFQALPDAVKSRYEWKASGSKTGTGTRNDQLPAQATYNESTKTVTWDLGDDYELENNVTYEIALTVWPKQSAYDLVADLNNGDAVYENLSDAEKAQVRKNADGSYELYTNWDENDPKHAYVEYRQVADVNGTITQSEPKTSKYNRPDPIPLEVAEIDIVKEWLNEDGSALTDAQLADLPDSIEFKLMRNNDVISGTRENGSEVATITLEKSEDWTAKYYLATGLKIIDPATSGITDVSGLETARLTTNNGTYYILENGHNYWLEEVTDIDSVIEFESGDYHPMLMNSATGAQNVEIQADSTGACTYAVTPTAADSRLVGTNKITGSNGVRLAIKKVADDEETPLAGAKFELLAGIPLPPGYDPAGRVYVNVCDPKEWVPQYPDIPSLSHMTVLKPIEIDSGTNGNTHGDTYVVPSVIAAARGNGANPSISLTGKDNGYSVDAQGNRIKNANNAYVRYLAVRTQSGPEAIIYTTGADGTVDLGELPDGAYRIYEREAPAGYSKLISAITVTISDGAVTAIEVADPSHSYDTETLADGSIAVVIPNTPVYEIELLKVETGKPNVHLGGAEFEVYTDQACTKKAKDSDGVEIGTITTSSNAESLGKANISNLNAGIYYIKEVKAPDGYQIMTDVIRLEIKSDGTATINPINGITLENPDGNNVIKLTVPNSAGKELPETGGIGTTILYTLGGILVIGAGLLLIVRRRVLR